MASFQPQSLANVMQIKEYKGKKGNKKNATEKTTTEKLFEKFTEKVSEKVNETAPAPTLTTEEQIKKFYTKSLNNYGITEEDIKTIIEMFFESEKSEQKTYETTEENAAEDEADLIMQEMVSKHRKKPLTSYNGLSKETITIAAILLIIDVNKWFSKDTSITTEIKEKITEFQQYLSNLPSLFIIPKTSNIPQDFVVIFNNLGLSPMQFEITADLIAKHLVSHIEALNLINIKAKYNQDIISMLATPPKRQLAISHNKLLNQSQIKQKLTAFIIGCAMINKPPPKIDFLPAKFIDTIATVYPTIGSCVKAFNTKKGSTHSDIFDEWAKTDLAKSLMCDQEFKPSEDNIKRLFETSLRIYSGLYNTMTNRNCFSKTHVYTDENGKRTIFPFMPVDFIKHISHTFPSELFKTTVDEMSDHRFISTSLMMSMIITILVASFMNPDPEINHYVAWIDEAIEDYHTHIVPIKGETKEAKFERINVANKALYEVIKYMDSTLDKTNICLLMTAEEKKAFISLFDGIYNLFPDNKTKKHNGSSNNTEKVVAKGTEQYFNDFPTL
jgi:hypothetical protein